MGSETSSLAKEEQDCGELLHSGDYAPEAPGGLVVAQLPECGVSPEGPPLLAVPDSGTFHNSDGKFAAACQDYFCRFDRNRDGRLSFEELRALAGAVCDVWKVAAPDGADLARAYERHSPICEGDGLGPEGFAVCAGELLAGMAERHPGLVVPAAADVLAARGRAAARALLHAILPVNTRSLQSMGAGGVVVVLSEVRGLPAGEESVLTREDELCCQVAVRRRGRLLPRRCTRVTALAAKSSMGQETVWRFDEELLFDDPSLLSRRGRLTCSVAVRRGRGLLPCSLATVESVQLPTVGTISMPLADPSRGRVEGEVQLSVGWQCSEPLAQFVAEDLRHHAKHGRWQEARQALQQNGTEAAERVAASADGLGRTLLMLAARSVEGTPLLRDLLALKTPAWLLADSMGATAAHFAALSGSLEALAALLGSGLPADAPAPGLRGATPLMLAALRGAADHVRLLLGHGAHADRLDDSGLPAAAWGLGCQAALGTSEADSELWNWVCANANENSVCEPDENNRREALSLLIEELWRTSPPLERSGRPVVTVNFAKLWLPLASHAAAAEPLQLFRRVLHSEVQDHCGSRQRHKRLLTELFEQALKQKQERLAVRLVSELGVLEPEGACKEDRPPSVQAALEVAVDAGMCRLACALLEAAGTLPDGRPVLGPPSNALRMLCLATERGDMDLTRAVLQRMPLELPRDSWEEPAVLPGHRATECPVCFQPLSEQPVVLCGPQPQERAVCPHFVCRTCGERLGGRCPLCRTPFHEVRPLPDPSEDPVAWFHFASGATHEPSSSSTTPPPCELSREALLNVLPVTLPLDPSVLETALSKGLWGQWDTDGDGAISKKDFFEPFKGLLRWLLVHQHELKAAARAGELPDLATDKSGWYQCTVASSAAPGCLAPAGLSKGDALAALLRLAGISSLDETAVEQFRKGLADRWSQWDRRQRGLVAEAEFVRKGGLADYLLAESSLACANRAVQKLRAASANSEAGTQVEALALLCSSAAGLSDRASPNAGAAAFAASFAQRLRKGVAAGTEELYYGEALPLILAAVDKHPQNAQVLCWASRALISLALGLSDEVANVPPEEVSWPRLAHAALGAPATAAALAKRLSQRLGGQRLRVASRLAKAMGCLCAVPGAAVERTFHDTMAAVLLLLRLLAEEETEEVLQALLQPLQRPQKVAVPAVCAFACFVVCVRLCDASRVLSQLQAWGHECPVPWAPPCALPPAAVSVGQSVEVCCQGGWQRGVVARAPSSDPAQPRDECWVVDCDGDSRTYSRHVWALGWALEAKRSLERMRLGLLSLATCPRQPVACGVELRRALLDAILVRSLGPKALKPLALPSGPVLRGAPGVQIRVGDKVWMGVSVERARQLQTQRHGDWSDQMSFCLDCPGRVLEALVGPPRVRVSHGSLGVFLWNPAAITRAEATCEALPFEEQHGPLVIGDEVLLAAEQEKVVPLQVGHGGWSARMSHCLGRYSRVVGFHNRGDVRVDTPGCGAFLWNPAVVEAPGGGSAAWLSAQAVARLDEEGSAILLLLALARLSRAEDGNSEALADVLSALERASEGQPEVPTRLRAYGALVLLAASLDFGQVLGQACSKVPAKGVPTQLEVWLPSSLSPGALAALSSSPAMAWPAADTGGVSFADVVEGKADAVVAVGKWLVTFFDARHPRMLDPARPVVVG